MPTSTEVTRLIESEYRRAEEARVKLGHALARAEAEWRHWRGLMSLHGLLRQGPEQQPQPALDLDHVRPTAIAPSDAPVVLVRNAAGKTGVSQVILDTVKTHPGLEQSALLDLLQQRATANGPGQRKNLRNMVKYLKTTGKLAQREGRYYLAENRP